MSWSPSTQLLACPCLSGLPPPSGARPSRAPLLRVPLARSRPSGLPPPCPWRCAAAHCVAYSRAASLNSLSLSSVLPSAETELLMLLSRRTSSSAAATADSTSALAAASSIIASLAALTAVAVVSAVACSCSSAAATSASYRCCALEATER
jgi:hypothetical protein